MSTPTRFSSYEAQIRERDNTILMLQTQIGDLQLQKDILEKEMDAKLQQRLAQNNSDQSERDRQNNREIATLKASIKNLETERERNQREFKLQFQEITRTLEEEKERHRRTQQQLSEREESLRSYQYKSEDLHARLEETRQNGENVCTLSS
ncbi:hypothetical protein BLNAU_4545 [Blattamonas nauphoetae]|uniref:Uncharacterized protein n=1 Tax=Blattamonas nauphoetae TaxID=2049346 RepID=A0ABQ9Y988_9EUKA|nr:hypothetical protein BLNAU_4545 [Blattamonas nauphoetae]